MGERFRLTCALILALSVLLHPFASRCSTEILQHPSRNAEDSSSVVEEQRSRLDPAIRQIFRGPSDRDCASDPERAIERERSGEASARFEEIDEHARAKRETVAKRTERRSLPKTGGASPRSSRSSRDHPLSPEKDREVPVDADGVEYSGEPEDDSVAGPRETKYRGGEFRVGEDTGKYIDQEDRSSLYDDFEAKDVVKRGIAGAEDYEELDEEEDGYVDDAAEEERGALDEDVEKRKRAVHGDVRVKRERESLKEADGAELAGRTDGSGASRDADASLKAEVERDGDSGAAESQGKRVEKESSRERQSKRSIDEKIEIDVSKESPGASKQPLTSSDQAEMENSGGSKLESQEATGSKEQEIDSLNEPSNLGGPSKLDEPKTGDVSSLEAAKVDVPASNLDGVPSDEASRLESSRGGAGEQDGGYEKRVEKQIQRKIDSIKEEIKREIAEKQRVREIEENNARFDELRDQEEEDEVAADPSERRGSSSKRSLESSAKVQARDSAQRRPTRRRKRQGDGGGERSTGESDSGKRAGRATGKKRSVGKSEQQSLNDLPRKREYPREVFLVKRDRPAGTRRRRRRTRSGDLGPEQRSGKRESDSEIGELGGGKVKGSD